MSIGNDDRVDTFVAVVTGAIIGVAVTLLFFRMQRRRMVGSKTRYDDYYDGEDLFI